MLYRRRSFILFIFYFSPEAFSTRTSINSPLRNWNCADTTAGRSSETDPHRKLFQRENGCCETVPPLRIVKRYSPLWWAAIYNHDLKKIKIKRQTTRNPVSRNLFRNIFLRGTCEILFQTLGEKKNPKKLKGSATRKKDNKLEIDCKIERERL